MSSRRRSPWWLVVMACSLAACGGEAEDTAEPSSAAAEEGEGPEASGAEDETAEADEPAAEGEEAAAPAPGDDLPVPVPPASWRATMNELTVDGSTVRFVSATCGAIAVMPLVQAVLASTDSCTERADTQLAATFEGGRLMAVNTSGPGAACVRAGVLRTNTNATCQVQLSFGAAPAAPAEPAAP